MNDVHISWDFSMIENGLWRKSILGHIAHPMQFAHNFVGLCFSVLRMSLFLDESHDIFTHALQWCKNVVNFLQNINKRHPIARTQGRGMGCLLWVQSLIDILPYFLQLCVQYHVILDCVIMVFDCMCHRYFTDTGAMVSLPTGAMVSLPQHQSGNPEFMGKIGAYLTR